MLRGRADRLPPPPPYPRRRHPPQDALELTTELPKCVARKEVHDAMVDMGPGMLQVMNNTRSPTPENITLMRNFYFAVLNYFADALEHGGVAGVGRTVQQALNSDCNLYQPNRDIVRPPAMRRAHAPALLRCRGSRERILRLVQRARAALAARIRPARLRTAPPARC